MAETEGTGQRERRETRLLLDRRGNKDRWAHQDPKVCRGQLEFQDFQDLWGRKVCVGTLDWLGFGEAREILDLVGQQGRRVSVDSKVYVERRGCVETPDWNHQQEGPPTFAGEGQPVQVAMELSYSTLEEQEELTGGSSQLSLYAR